MSSANQLQLTFSSRSAERRQSVEVRNAVIGGWTARDAEAMEHHIQELVALGVKRPAATPLYYRVSAARLTTADAIQVMGKESSGEAEFVLLKIQDALWVGVGSDHTDREVETVGITVAKQLCDKPIGSVFWPLEEVAQHWDQLELRSHINSDGKKVLYQEGPLSNLLAPQELISKYVGAGEELAEGTLLFGGTMPAIGGVRFAEHYELELFDPVLDRRISHAYGVEPLPVVG